MTQEIGESIEAWGRDVISLVEKFANKMSAEVQPFYIIYACKQDLYDKHKFHQTVKAYYHRPPSMLGILVWYYDPSSGDLAFVPELSAPPDMPLDPNLLSDKLSDFSGQLAQRGKDLQVLLS